MIQNIDPLKSALTSLTSAGIGTMTKYLAFIPTSFMTLDRANTCFQHAAWTIAILAGIVSIVNGVRQWHFKRKTNNEND